MPKSYKITTVDKFEDAAFSGQPLNLTRQMHLDGTVPGPQTIIKRSPAVLSTEDFRAYNIEHEYAVRMQGRLYDQGNSFSKFIAKSEIVGYESSSRATLLLCGRKADILDFCKRTSDIPQITLKVIQIDMARLQEKLTEVNGVWFRCRKGFIRAKGFMGSQIQDTQEFRAAKSEGEISTLSFYFDDPRDDTPHPIMITEDGTVVLQSNYQNVDEEISFVLQVKARLIDGIFAETPIGNARKSITGLAE